MAKLCYYWTNFHNFVTVKFRKDIWRKMELKLPPPLKSVATLPCESKWSAIQLYSTVNSVHSDKKRLIAVNVHEECHFFVFFSTRLIYVLCLKCSPLAHTCFESSTSSTSTICGDACPLSCASAEAYKLAQCTRPQGWGS